MFLMPDLVVRHTARGLVHMAGLDKGGEGADATRFHSAWQFLLLSIAVVDLSIRGEVVGGWGGDTCILQHKFLC